MSTEPDNRTYEQKLAAYRVAKDLLDPKNQALDDDMEFRFALEKLEKPRLVGFELELK